MKKKDYVPILYILIYRDIKNRSVNGLIDLADLKSILGYYHIKKCYHAVVTKELSSMSMLDCKGNRVIVYDLKIDRILESTSKMYRYVGCY